MGRGRALLEGILSSPITPYVGGIMGAQMATSFLGDRYNDTGAPQLIPQGLVDTGATAIGATLGADLIRRALARRSVGS